MIPGLVKSIVAVWSQPGSWRAEENAELHRSGVPMTAVAGHEQYPRGARNVAATGSPQPPVAPSAMGIWL